MGEYDKIICNAYQLYGIEGILMYLEQSVPLSVFIEFSFVHKCCGGLFIEHRERIKFWFLFDFIGEFLNILIAKVF